MASIKQTYRIEAPVADVWQALVDPRVITAWGAGPAIMDDKVGTEFRLWDGSIHGKNTEVIPQKKLVQDWYNEDWTEPSIAVFELSEEDGGTRLDFNQENVPDAELRDIEDGWFHFYIGAIKKYLEER